MKRLILHILALAPLVGFGQTISNLTAGELASKMTGAFPNKTLRISGQMNAADFSYILDKYQDVEVLDLQNVTIEAYNGDALPYTGMSTSPAATIPAYGLTGLTSLRSVTLPAGLKAIGKGAFSGSGLTSVSIPSSCTEIGDYAFMRCEALTSVAIPASVTEIGQRAFAYCTALTTVNIAEESALASLPEGLFEACGGLKDLNLGALAECTEIGPWALADCNGLTVLVLPENVATLGESSLYATSVATLALPASLDYIGDNGMGSMTALETLNAVDMYHVPDLGSKVWNNVNQSAVTLVTPDDMVANFSDAAQWQDFTIKSQSDWESSTEQVKNELGAAPLKVSRHGDDLLVQSDKELGRVSVYNVSGHQVATAKADGNNARFNVGSWPRGVYLVVTEAGVAKVNI